MRDVWYMTLLLLMLGVLAGFVGMSSPTIAVVANLPPRWDYPTDEFSTPGRLVLDLDKAFFDPDGDPLAFSVSPGPGVSAGVNGDELVVFVDTVGEVVITASDGKSLVSKTIIVRQV